MSDDPIVQRAFVVARPARPAGEAPLESAATAPDPGALRGAVQAMPFDDRNLAAVRALAHNCAVVAGLAPERVDDVVLVTNEAASNAIEHGGGGGTIRTWIDDMALVIEVSNPVGGPIDQSVGLLLPALRGRRGRGLWLMRQLTDLLEIHPDHPGSTVRMHVRI